jgi:uracil-DNA glycosylase
VGKLRGRLHRYQGVPVVVSYHPAYLLRQPQEKAKAWDDLCLAADTAEAGDRATAETSASPASAGG